MSDIVTVDRRDFLTALGVGVGGLTLARLGVGDGVAFAKKMAASFSPNVFVSLAPTGVLTVTVARSEMGQGVRTALPMIIADEMEADWNRVVIRQADGDKSFGDQNTDGSTSVRNFYRELRMFGGTAREMLISAAAKQWKVPRGQCRAEMHRVVHERSKRSLSYGELATAAAKEKVPNERRVKLKSHKDFRYIGKSKPLLDGEAFTTGSGKYGADIVLPDMLTAVIMRPPVLGAKPTSIKKDAALAVDGVVLVEALPVVDIPAGFTPLGGVAVIADNTWAAIQGRKKLEVEWAKSPHSDYDSVAFRKTLEQTVSEPGDVVRKQGNVSRALEGAKVTHEATYYLPHLAQAPMEPPACVAKVTDTDCEIWAPTQDPQTARGEVAKALKLKPESVHIHVTLLGGGFGRKSKPDFIVEAALLSQRAGVPIRVQWTREDDLRHGFYHTVSAQRLQAGMDENNKVTAWHHRTAFPTIMSTFAPTNKPGAAELGMGVTDLPFDIPNVAMEAGAADSHLRIGWMRSVCNMQHAFAIGSFVDELAALAREDARDFWLKLLGKQRKLNARKLGMKDMWNYGAKHRDHAIDTGRLTNVIEIVTERAGWGKKKAVHLGLAAHRSFAAYVAVVAKVRKGPRPGQIVVDRIHCVIDCGQVIHRERVQAQMEGAMVFGLSLALHGEISAKAGRVEQGNFHTYPVLRMNETPRVVDVHIVDSHAYPGGVGEPGVPPVAPALANALYAATGKRVRDLPLSRHGITTLT